MTRASRVENDATISGIENVGACAMRCSDDPLCNLFEYDVASEDDSGLSKSRLMAEPVDTATTKQCWATRALFEATTTTNPTAESCAALSAPGAASFMHSDDGCYPLL